jgi:hypothetical protein
MMPQITSLSGIQLVQRGKKLAMRYHANAAPLDNTSDHHKSILRSECAAFRRSKRFRFLLRLRGSQDSINLSGGSKIKFIIQFHADKSVRLFPLQKKRTIRKADDVKSSAARQAWKRDIDSVVEAVSFSAAAFGRTFCELGTKTTTGFLCGWVFYWGNGARRRCRSSLHEREHLHG